MIIDAMDLLYTGRFHGFCLVTSDSEFVGKQSPEFDSRNYGYSKLSSLIEAIGLFEIDRTEKHLRIRRNPQKNA